MEISHFPAKSKAKYSNLVGMSAGVLLQPGKGRRKLSGAVATVVSIWFLTGCSQFDLKRELERSQQQLQQGLSPSTVGATNTAALGTESRALPAVSQQSTQAGFEAYFEQALSQQQAVQLALQHSPAIQARLANYQQTGWQLDQQSYLLNPRLSLERQRQGAETELSRILSVSLLDMLSLPERRNWVQHALAQAQTQLVSDLIAQSLLVKQAWLQAIAAERSEQILQDTAALYQAAAELAQAMQSAGNFSVQQAERFAVAEAEFKSQLWAAQLRRQQSRSQLARLIGWPLSQQAQLRLPENLPALPAQLASASSVSQEVLPQRLDLQASASRLKLAFSTARLALPESLGQIELGWRQQRNKSEGEAVKYTRGVEVSLSLPVFNWGDASRQASLAGSQAAAWDYQNNLQMAAYQVADAYQDYLSSHAIAQHHLQSVLPLRQRLAQQSLLRYNGMLISVFDLLDEVKLRLQAELAQQQHLLNFHLSELKLQAALAGVPGFAETSGIAGETPRNNTATAGDHK